LDQKSVLSLPCSSASEEGCEDGDEEEEDSLSKVMELVKSLSAKLEMSESVAFLKKVQRIFHPLKQMSLEALWRMMMKIS
jgi:hypothetical protein